MKLDARLLAAVVFLVPALSFADPLSNRGLEETAKKGPAMTDAMIDDKKKVLDRVLAKRTEETIKEASDGVAMEGKLKQERIDFEKKQIADRKAFLDTLKKDADAKKRTGLYSRFNTDQKNDRRRFFNGQNDSREELANNARRARLMAHDDVVLSAVVAAPAKTSTKVASAHAPAKKGAAKPAATKKK